MSPVRAGKIIRQRLLKGITGLDRLTAAAQSRADQGWLYGLDRRKIAIRSAHSALNTLLQSAGAIVMKKAFEIFWIENEDKHGVEFRLLANVHDEQQIQCPTPELAEKYGSLFSDAIRRAGVALDLGVELDGEFSLGNNWSETH